MASADLEADLNNLVMGEEAQPLLDAVVNHCKTNVEPIQEEFHALDDEKDDPWSWHPRQLELLDGAKQKAKDSGLWNFFLPDADTCLLYTSPSPRDQRGSRMPSSA